MALKINHAKVSAASDGANPALIQPSDWNANLSTEMSTGKLLGRYSASTGPVEEITLGDGLTLAANGLMTAAGGSETFFDNTHNYTSGPDTFNTTNSFGLDPNTNPHYFVVNLLSEKATTSEFTYCDIQTRTERFNVDMGNENSRSGLFRMGQQTAKGYLTVFASDANTDEEFGRIEINETNGLQFNGYKMPASGTADEVGKVLTLSAANVAAWETPSADRYELLASRDFSAANSSIIFDFDRSLYDYALIDYEGLTMTEVASFDDGDRIEFFTFSVSNTTPSVIGTSDDYTVGQSKVNSSGTITDRRNISGRSKMYFTTRGAMIVGETNGYIICERWTNGSFVQIAPDLWHDMARVSYSSAYTGVVTVTITTDHWDSSASSNTTKPNITAGTMRILGHKRFT